MDVVGPAGAASEPRDGKRVTDTDSITTHIQLGDNSCKNCAWPLLLLERDLRVRYCHRASRATSATEPISGSNSYVETDSTLQISSRVHPAVGSAVEKLGWRPGSEHSMCRGDERLGKSVWVYGEIASTEKEAMELAQNKKVAHKGYISPNQQHTHRPR